GRSRKESFMRGIQRLGLTIVCGLTAIGPVCGVLAGTVATGDFNGDGFLDLAISVTGEDVGSAVDAGVVQVIYGSAAKLTATNNQVWNQNKPGIDNQADPNDHFGSDLAVGDFNGDGFDDLAIAVVGEVIHSDSRGAVHILYGSVTGLQSV